jgi:hypothetical protein
MPATHAIDALIMAPISVRMLPAFKHMRTRSVPFGTVDTGSVKSGMIGGGLCHRWLSMSLMKTDCQGEGVREGCSEVLREVRRVFKNIAPPQDFAWMNASLSERPDGKREDGNTYPFGCVVHEEVEA